MLNLARGVKGAGSRPVIASLQPGPFASEMAGLGFEVVVVGCGVPRTLSGGLLNCIAMGIRDSVASRERARAVAAALRQFGPDGVHVLWPNMVEIAGRAGHELGAVPVWEMPNIISNSAPFGLNRRVYRSICGRWGVTVMSDSDYTGTTYGRGAHKPITFYHSVDSPRFDPERVTPRTRASLGIPEGAQVFGIVARIGGSKGQLPFFEGLMRCQNAGEPPRHLLLLGGPTDGADANAMREVARRAGCADRVHFAGVVNDAETYYPVTDVGVNSRVDPEPFGISVIESMLMGRPVLAHALGGPAETVLDGRTGWHTHSTTPDGWEGAIRRVLADAPRWAEMGNAARAYAVEKFSMERMAARYLEIVDRAMEAKRAK